MSSPLDNLLQSIRTCNLCSPHLPCGPRPVLLAESSAVLLIAGQAPGRRVHASGIPFDDPSGDRLRQWLGIDRKTFYDTRRIAILPMGFCYPGTGQSGDFPPRPECATTWRQPLLALLPNIQLILAIGRYAQKYHCPGNHSLTRTVANWRHYWQQTPRLLPLPHPSPRNQMWWKRNPWFAADVVPALQEEVARRINGYGSQR